MAAFRINKSVAFFLLKMFAMILVWEYSYHFFLKPVRIPDKLLTDIVTIAVTKCLNIFFSSAHQATWVHDMIQPLDDISRDGKIFLQIFDGCNGLDLITIYLLLIIVLPGTFKRKILFSLAGIIGITILNILRCLLLYWIYKTHPNVYDFNHHYTFTILMYLVIFYGWLLFTKNLRQNEAR